MEAWAALGVGFVLNKVYDLLAKDPVDDRYKPFRDYTKNLRKLDSTLSAVQAALKGAHRRPITEPDLLDWISKLKDASFDADDVLDAIASEAFLRRAHPPSKLLAFFSHRNPILFRCRIGYRIGRVLKRLDDVADEKKFQIGGGGSSASSAAEERQTHSSAPNTVVGREVDRGKVLDLLGTGGEAEGFGVVAIVGMSGSGKTTLAQMVFKEFPQNQSSTTRDVKRIWVYVGQDFSLRRIAKGVLEGMGKKLEFTELEGVKTSLVEAVKDEEVLLVLDDVWNERKDVWVDVEGLLRCGTRGRRVLVTTRNERVAAVMDAKMHRMEGLSEDDCWSLLKMRAFGGREEPAAKLVEIGMEIAKKGKGLPLVANVLGGLMINKTQESQWLEVKDNDIWDCFRDEQEDETEIHPALRLSYFHLPLRSKPCFAYCALFHKGYTIDKGKVIQQWVANGFVTPRGHRELESIGEEIFDDLVARRLLLHANGEEGELGNATSYKMHDMVHDLATFVSKNECHILTDPQINKDLERIRFLSIHGEPSLETLKVLCKICKSRTLVVTSMGRPSININFLKGVFRRLKLLRVLDLSSCDVNEIPKGIGDLIHLRYIDFSNTGVTSLPGEICSLVNLMTLDLCSCGVKEIPKGIGDLIHLRYIDFSNTGVTSLPGEICSLVNLRTLNLSSCNVKEIPRGIGDLIHLRYIDFSNTGVTSVPREICSLVNLRTLRIRNCNITQRPEGLSSITNLDV